MGNTQWKRFSQGSEYGAQNAREALGNEVGRELIETV